MAEQKATLPTWARTLAIVVGVISIGASIIVLLFPFVALLTLVILLGIALLFMGMDRLVAGITGHPYAWVTVVPAGVSLPANQTPIAPNSPP
ncbi:MAG TPA: DUF308 domain-containing protein [Thermoplasmata archaeon]|jgi:uncharacterized membrane protein HdeD (DUF308 family)|nr:DUF308 domain-containing protein [Thermoplasmata archaeon]